MKRIKLLALLAAFALVVAACGGDDSAETTTTTADPGSGDTTTTTEAQPMSDAGQGGNLLLLQWQAPSQVNALLTAGTKDLLASSIVLEPLARYGPDGAVVPTLVTEVPTVANGGVAPDFTSVTWNLIPGILWSDGTPLTSDDVVFTYEYCLDDLTGCAADFTKVTNVEAIDELTVKVTFADPQPFPYADFVGYSEPIIQRAQFQDCVGEQASACTDQNFAPVGTGPYMVTEMRPEDTVLYEYNPLFRGNADGQPYFGTVELKGGGDAEAAARSVLEIGEADYGWNLQVAPEILLPMEEAGNGKVVTSFTAAVEHINLNQTDPDGDPPSEYVADGSGNNPVFFDNEPLARALSLAIDRDALVQVGYGPTGRPICTMWPVGEFESPNNDWCKTRDVAQANQILDDLGYLDTDDDGVREAPGYGPLEFDYVTSTNAVRQSNQAIIKQNWEDIGVVANMSNQDSGLFFDGTSASDFSIWKFFTDIQMFTNDSTSGPDPVTYLSFWRIDEIPTAALGWPASNNIVRMQSAEFDALWDETSQLSIDDDAFIPNIHELQDLIIESGSTIPLIHRGNVSAISNDIMGFGEPNGWDSEYWNIHEWTK